jgi:Xaa-Pro aminopeptidase
MTAEVLQVAELDRRLVAVRDAMRERGFDGLVVADPANIFYLTGYNAWSFYTPQVFYVPLEGAPVLAMREMDALGAHRTAIRYGDDVLGYPEALVHRPDTHPMKWVAEQLRERGYAGGRGAAGASLRIGFEGDAHFFAVRSYLALRDGLPEWDLVESGELVNWVRLVKSDFEIAQMRKAGRVASEAMDRAVAAIAEGRPLNELAAEVMAAQARGAAASTATTPPSCRCSCTARAPILRTSPGPRSAWPRTRPFRSSSPGCTIATTRRSRARSLSAGRHPSSSASRERPSRA